jgi:hypothetical protein
VRPATWAAVAVASATAGVLVSAWLVRRDRAPSPRARALRPDDAAAIHRMESEGGPPAPPKSA